LRARHRRACRGSHAGAAPGALRRPGAAGIPDRGRQRRAGSRLAGSRSAGRIRQGGSTLARAGAAPAGSHRPEPRPRRNPDIALVQHLREPALSGRCARSGRARAGPKLGLAARPFQCRPRRRCHPAGPAEGGFGHGWSRPARQLVHARQLQSVGAGLDPGGRWAGCARAGAMAAPGHARRGPGRHEPDGRRLVAAARAGSAARRMDGPAMVARHAGAGRIGPAALRPARLRLVRPPGHATARSPIRGAAGGAGRGHVHAGP
jgi:hypothetical protein